MYRLPLFASLLVFLMAVVRLPAAGADSSGEPASARPEPMAAAAEIDRLLYEEVLQAVSQEKIAPKTSDTAFLRRVSFDITGTPPTPAEITAFVLDPAADKRSRAVERLLADRRYAANWARYWRDVIMYRRSEERGLLAAGPLQEYLTEAIRENRGWDEIARNFITAEGDVREDGRTALIMAQMGQPEETVAEISRIFLGIQIQCAQCHDHPFDSWTREQFHELAAFFPRVAVRPTQGDTRSFVVVASDRPSFRPAGGANRFAGTSEHSMPDLERPEARGRVMTPRFFLNDESLRLGTADAQRRGKLAEWITEPANPWFAKAYVNRLWSELVGEGFFEPVDDIGPERTPHAPRTLEYLAASFATSGYDTQWLLRTIIATEAYQRESRSRRAYEDLPFLANVPQRLRADQLYDALSQTLGRDLGDGFQARRGGGIYGLASARAAFAGVFGYDPSDPRREVSGAIPQALALMNSPGLNQLVTSSRGPLSSMMREMEDNEEIVVELYLRAISREPESVELARCLEHVAKADSRTAAFEDILWVLINSSEFLHRG